MKTLAWLLERNVIWNTVTIIVNDKFGPIRERNWQRNERKWTLLNGNGVFERVDVYSQIYIIRFRNMLFWQWNNHIYGNEMDLWGETFDLGNALIEIVHLPCQHCSFSSWLS